MFDEIARGVVYARVDSVVFWRRKRVARSETYNVRTTNENNRRICFRAELRVQNAVPLKNVQISFLTIRRSVDVVVRGRRRSTLVLSVYAISSGFYRANVIVILTCSHLSYTDNLSPFVSIVQREITLFPRYSAERFFNYNYYYYYF